MSDKVESKKGIDELKRLYNDLKDFSPSEFMEFYNGKRTFEDIVSSRKLRNQEN